MPEAEKVIHCAVCGVGVRVQRLSARYCKDCKPKAMVLNAVIRNLNRLLNVDPSGLGVLLGTSTPVSDRLMDAFSILEATQVYDVLSVINIGLSEFGRIEFTGTEFRIRPTSEQQTLRMAGLRGYITASQGSIVRPEDWNQLHQGTPMGVDQASEGGEAIEVATFRRHRTRTGGAIHISELRGRGVASDPISDGDEREDLEILPASSATRPVTLIDQSQRLRRYQDGNPRHF